MIEFDPHSITHAHLAPMLSVSDVIDDGYTIAILGDVDHPHPDEITVRWSLDENVTTSTLPNTDGAWSLTMQSSSEHFYLNITANHDLEETFSPPSSKSTEQFLQKRTATRVNRRISHSIRISRSR